MFDVIVRGGRVLDPAQGIDATLEIGIIGPRIAALGPDLHGRGVRREVIDATGLLVTPGLVDLHTHVYWGVAPLGVEPDPTCLARGVTTAVDAGSAGASTFPAFHRYVIEVSATRIVAMLNISTIGMARDDAVGDEAIGELEEIRWANVDRAIDVARAYADAIVGIKVRLGPGQVGPDPDQAREALRRAKQAADAIGKPTMVHIGATTVSLDELLPALNPGDVVTHCFHGRTEGVLDEGGTVRPVVRQAVARGVNFDVGHGAGSFNFAVARAALEEDLLPGTISSDIHTWNIAGPVYDLATTASKFLHLGVPLPEVLRRVTATPAAAIGLTGQIGTLAPGAAADVSLFRLASGEWHFRDSYGNAEVGGQRLEPVAVLRAGRHYPCTPSGYLPHPAGH
jgi:dihydroorotase